MAPLKLRARHYGKWVLGTQRGQVGTCVGTPSHRTGASRGSPQRKMEVGSKATGEVGVGSEGALGWGEPAELVPHQHSLQCIPSVYPILLLFIHSHIPLWHGAAPHSPVHSHTPIPPYLQCSPISFISPNLSVYHYTLHVCLSCSVPP